MTNTNNASAIAPLREKNIQNPIIPYHHTEKNHLNNFDKNGAYEPSKPILETKKKYWAERYAHMLEKSHNTLDKYGALCEKIFDNEEKKYTNATKKEAQKLSESIRKTKSATTWDSLHSAASAMGILSTIFAGTTTAPLGISVVLIGSGSSLLINQIMKKTHGWDSFAKFFSKSEENQKKIAKTMSISIDTVASLLSLAGIGGISAASNIFQASSWLKTTENFAEVASNVTSSITSMGQGFSGYAALKAQTQGHLSTAKAETHKMNLYEICKTLGTQADTQTNSFSAAANVTRAYLKSLQITTSAV